MNGDSDQGRIAVNLMGFARVLRRAGLPVGPGRMLQAVAAAEAVGLANREDFYWALHAVFVNRQDQRELFDQAFHIFWRNPKLLERMAGLTIPVPADEQPADGREISRRVAEAMAPKRRPRAHAWRALPKTAVPTTPTKIATKEKAMMPSIKSTMTN